MTDCKQWTLHAAGPRRPRQFVVGVYATREAALDAAQRLWKQSLHPTRIVGPAGEMVDTAEIERFGQEHPDAAD